MLPPCQPGNVCAMISHALCSGGVHFGVPLLGRLRNDCSLCLQNGCDQDRITYRRKHCDDKSYLKLIASKVIAVDDIHKSHQRARAETLVPLAMTLRHNCHSRSPSLNHSWRSLISAKTSPNFRAEHARAYLFMPCHRIKRRVHQHSLINSSARLNDNSARRLARKLRTTEDRRRRVRAHNKSAFAGWAGQNDDNKLNCTCVY